MSHSDVKPNQAVSVPTPKWVVFLSKSSQVIFLLKPRQVVTHTLVNNAIVWNYFQLWINTQFVLQSLFKTVIVGLTQNKLHQSSSL